MAGTQEDLVKEAGHALWQAKQDVQEAERAPHTGSATSEALKNAKMRRTNAERTFDTTYTAYQTSMTAARQRPASKESFIIQK